MALTLRRIFSQKISGYVAWGSKVPIPIMAISDGCAVFVSVSASDAIARANNSVLVWEIS